MDQGKALFRVKKFFYGLGLSAFWRLHSFTKVSFGLFFCILFYYCFFYFFLFFFHMAHIARWLALCPNSIFLHYFS